MTRLATPNTCQIPNAFFDVLLPQLGDAELRVMLYLMRQTFGWNRDWTEKGFGRLDQICKSAGISRQGAINALKGLRERGAVESRKVGVAFEYRVRVHDVDTSTDQGQPVNVVDRPHVQSTTLTDGGQPGGPDPVNVVDREPVNDVDRIKRQSSKPTENPNEEAAADAAEDAGEAARSAAAAGHTNAGLAVVLVDAEPEPLTLAGAVALVAFGHADATVPTKHLVEYDKAVRLLGQGGYSADDVLDADDHWRRAYERRHDRQPTSARVTQVVQHCAEWRLATQPEGPLFDRAAYGRPDDDGAPLPAWPPPADPAPLPPTTAQDLWQRTLTALQLQMTRATFDAWLKRTRAIELDGDTLVVEVPNAATRDWLTSRLANAMRDAVATVAGPEIEWRFVVAEREAVVA